MQTKVNCAYRKHDSHAALLLQFTMSIVQYSSISELNIYFYFLLPLLLTSNCICNNFVTNIHSYHQYSSHFHIMHPLSVVYLEAAWPPGAVFYLSSFFLSFLFFSITNLRPTPAFRKNFILVVVSGSTIVWIIHTKTINRGTNN